MYLYDSKNTSDFLNQDLIVKRAVKQLRQRGISTKIIEDVKKVKAGDGCLFIPYSFSYKFRDIIFYCNQKKIPVITVHVYPQHFLDCTYNTITRDPYVCMRQILAYFIYNIGPKPRISYFGMTSNTLVDVAKMDAIYSLYSEMKIEDFYFNDTGFADCFNSFYDKRNEYDAVICANSNIAIAFMEMMNERDPETAKRLTIISFLNTKISKLYHCPITIAAYSDDAIYDAVSATYKSFKKKADTISMNITLKNEIIVRESTHNMICPPEALIYELTAQYCVQNRFTSFASMEEREYDYTTDSMLAPILEVENLLNSTDDVDLKIMSMFLNGCKNSEISSRLFVSLQTVQYRSRIMFKILNVDNKSDFIKKVSRYISLEKLQNYILEFPNTEYHIDY